MNWQPDNYIKISKHFHLESTIQPVRKLWPFTFNFLSYASIAFVLPYIVLYYQRLGFNGAQIGLLTGITPLVVFFGTPLWSGLADVTGRYRLLMTLALLVASISLVVYPLLGTFLPLILVAILLYFSLAPINPFADSAAMFMLMKEKEMYGRIRLGGTIGFALAAPVAGLYVQNYGLRAAFWGAAALLLLGLVVSQKLRYGQIEVSNPTRGRFYSFLLNLRWILFLAVSFAGGLGFAASSNYLFPYMEELGAKESVMGVALTIGTTLEIPILFFGNRLIKHLNAYRLLMLSMVVTGLRLLLFAATTIPGLILVIQLLNGLGFPAMWMAGVSYADEIAPEGRRTTAQGLFSAMVLGFGAAIGGFTGGLLFEKIGGRGLFFVFGVVVLAIVTTVALVYRRLPAAQ